MFIARNSNNNLIPIDQASNDEDYFCPTCGEKLRVRDGEINVKHYAHISLNDCDDFSHDMSEWHKTWQEKFPVENREVVVVAGNECHRADILIGNCVIEFQHSPISAEEVKRRNDFYISAGYKVIWVFDVTEAFDNEQIEEDEFGKYFWKHASRAASYIVPQSDKNVAIVFQFTSGDPEEGYDPWLVIVDWAKPDGDDCVNYSTFYIDDHFDADLFSEEGRSDILLRNKRERFNVYLKRNAPWRPKCGRVKGNPRSWYICEKTGDWHNGSCESCPFNLIREYRRGTVHQNGGLFFYCCYPRVMHDIGHSELPDHERTPTIRI